MARRLKLYLDTSVISNLYANDAPEQMAYSQKLWIELKTGSYHVFISTLVISELSRCPEPKRSMLLEYLGQLEYSETVLTIEVEDLANEYISIGLPVNMQMMPII